MHSAAVLVSRTLSDMHNAAGSALGDMHNAAARRALGDGSTRADFWTRDGEIFTNAFGSGSVRSALKIKCVSWFGMESAPCQIGGLGEMSVRSGAAWLQENGFNAVRVPLAVDALLSAFPSGGCMPPELSAAPALSSGAEISFVSRDHSSKKDKGGYDYTRYNSQYVGLSYLGMVKRFAKDLGEHGLLVMLDLHAMEAGKWPDSGKVGDEGSAQLKEAWRLLATEMGSLDYWNVFAADLKNEPHGMYWGPLGTGDSATGHCEGDDPTFRDQDGDGCVQYMHAADRNAVCGHQGYEASCERCCKSCARASRCVGHGSASSFAYDAEDRWDVLAAELGRIVLSLAPRWLVVVEGVGHCMDPSSAGGSCVVPSSKGQNMQLSTWWVENMQAAERYQIRLPVEQKLVYSPHVYGPSVASQPYFNSPSFPRNMPSVWRTQWAGIPKLGSSPVVSPETHSTNFAT